MFEIKFLEFKFFLDVVGVVMKVVFFVCLGYRFRLEGYFFLLCFGVCYVFENE